MNQSIIRIFKGQKSIAHLLNDVYQTLKLSGGEVFISGIDERKFLELDKKVIINHIKRLAQAGIVERLLAREGDIFFFSGPQSLYRWVPENLFNPTPIYVYGDKVAMIIWTKPIEVIIITSHILADAYRKQFLFIWQRAKVPPTKNVTINERKRLAGAIIKRFGGKISSITDQDKRMFRDMLSHEKTKTYGNSFYYLCQTANGVGEQKLGLKYFDGEMLTTVGIFNRASLGGGWHFHIIHPLGKFDARKIKILAQSMLELSGNPVFVKKITSQQQALLLNSGFSPLEKYPWHSQATEEDDTFPEQILDIHKIIDEIEKPGKTDFKDKWQRFKAKYGEIMQSCNLSATNFKDVQIIVKKFFKYLEDKSLHISQVSDYDNIIVHPPLGKNGKTYFSQILYLQDRPVAFFAVEPNSPDSAGLYANITLHQEFDYLSEYLIVYICQLLKKAGYKYLNLGGSETSGLFQFKEKFLPVAYNKMHWVVYRYD